jgi:hypothetical protein
VGGAHEGGVLVAPPGREAQATEVASDELKTPKKNSFAKGEATARQMFTVSDDNEHR